MNQFFEDILAVNDLSTRVTLVDAFVTIFLTFILTLIITQVYKRTSLSTSYSPSFVHTIIVMGIGVSIIMQVIGNNLAVAFGLVGAFSIIRFRSAISDPKDIAFIFLGMGTGLVCGLGFYLLAILFTISVCIIMYILYLLDYGKRDEELRILRITIPENLHYERLFDDLFHTYLSYYSLVSVETTNLGTMIQLEYIIKKKKRANDKALMDGIRERNANLQVSIRTGNNRY